LSATALATTVGIYRPPTVDARGGRVLAWDEDSTTLAVEAARLVLGDDPADISAVIVVSRSPSYLVDDATAVIATALRLETAEVTQVTGAGSAALSALAAAEPGTIVIAVDTDSAPGAAAVSLGSPDAQPRVRARYRHSVPYHVRASTSSTTAIYDDERLVRERAWRPAIEALAGDEPAIVTGLPARVASRLGGATIAELSDGLESSWAALAAIAHGRRVVALDGASGVAVDVPSAADVTVVREDRAAYPAPVLVPGSGIPLSLAAYDRAFEPKVGLIASSCTCGAVHLPPRDFCPVCGLRGESQQLWLSHDVTVYSVVTVRVPIPSMPRVYSLAIVDFDDADVRLLVHVTGEEPGATAIGDRGRLVLRRVAVREGVPDYGYAFVGDGR
jgi:uncharacterized OB-fold protein